MTKQIYIICFFFSALFMFAFTTSAAAVDLFDGKLVIHGKWTNQLLMRAKGQEPEPEHHYDFMNARTSLKFEALWHAYEGPEYTVNVYSIWKNFYDAAIDIDSGYQNNVEYYNIGRNGYDRARSYDTFRDICRELYVDLISNLFQVRVGKQIISWGETDFERMVDNINPVDVNGDLNAAYPNFAELKQSLWMIRLFITPENMPADMTFELLVIPDFQPNRLPAFGYHLTLRNLSPTLQAQGEISESWYRDANDNWNSPEVGFRIRGFSWSIDWAISYFHHRSRGEPIPDEGFPFPAAAVFGTGRLENFSDYPWQSTFGLTLNKTVDRKITLIPGTSLAMSGSVMRFEGVWEKDKDNARQNADFSVSHQEKDRFAGVIGWDTKIYIPWLTPWARQEHLQSTTQLFMEFCPKKHRNDAIYPYVSYRPKGHHYSSVTQSLYMEFWHGRIIPAFYMNYYIDQGGGYYAPAIAFKPTFGWTIMLRYLDFKDYSESLDEKDYWTFEVTYEF